MSDKIDDGGPAFPMSCTRDGYAPNVPEGMSLRDWFAGQALGALVAETNGVFEENEAFAQAVALGSYAIADAMLAARKGKGDT